MPESGDVGDCEIVEGAIHKEGCCAVWTVAESAKGEVEATATDQDQGLPIGGERQIVNPETLPEPMNEGDVE
jgi:hypothetical protein